VITTNIINDEILDSVDILANKNIIFQIPLGQVGANRNINFDFQVDLHKWTVFAQRIRFLEFRGVFVDRQFTAKHLECMTSLEGLYIGSTNYKLFDNESIGNANANASQGTDPGDTRNGSKGYEDVSKLPMLTCLSLNGYGLVQQSPQMNTWFKTLTKHGCQINQFI
jgi:hypothetical protein